jgi:tetratricopeptide (TPR) repeat protein
MIKGFSHLAAALILTQLAGAAPAQQPVQAPQIKLSPQESAAITPVQTAVNARDFAAASAALPTAQAAAQSADARYAVGNLQFQIGRGTNNMTFVLAGTEAMLASGKVPQEQQAALYRVIAAAADATKDREKAERALTRFVELSPNDTDGMIALAQMRFDQNRIPDGLALVDRAIATRKASGQPVPEQWYRVAVERSMRAKLAPEIQKYGQAWIAAYPKPQTWRDVLISLRDQSAGDRELQVDVYRLMRATGALAGERDYADYVQSLSDGGYPGEAKAVMDEAIAAKQINPAKEPFGKFRTLLGNRATADRPSLPAQEKTALAAANGTPALKIGNAYFGYGDYAKAVTLYQAAAQKGSVDANLLNTRLGLALAMAGRKAEAEAAFRAIGGTRGNLGAFLLIWLSQRA